MKARTSKSLVVWTVVLALVAVPAALALVSCGSDDGQNGTTTTEPALALTAADNGKSFTIRVGDTITIELEGNPTTGYSWESAMADEAAPLVTLVGEPEFKQGTVGTNVVGAGGTYIFTFAAAAAGQTELKLKYWRSFEAQAEPLETFAVNLTIQ